jgi:hypothetical protein
MQSSGRRRYIQSNIPKLRAASSPVFAALFRMIGLLNGAILD